MELDKEETYTKKGKKMRLYMRKKVYEKGIIRKSNYMRRGTKYIGKV